MPRTARVKSRTGIYHIMLRGINRQIIFEDYKDNEKFLYTLGDYKEKCGYKIFAYCLMGNHIHLLIKEDKEDLGTALKRIGASYVYWYNWKYDRTGHLFQGRYKSEVVEDERYLFTVLRYIHQNPLKAGIVKDISEYKWSSYSEYLGESKIIDEEFVLDIMDKDRNRAISRFKELHKKSSDDNCLDIEEPRRLKDDEAIEIIKSTCDIPNCLNIHGFSIEDRDRYIEVLKRKGLSTRQLSRLTGISRGIILKI